MSGHTPGPWIQDRYGHINDKTGSTIRVQGLALSSGSEAKANAHLIAAAPDLLTALTAMLTHMGMDEDEWNKPTFDQSRAAIAKATGEQA